MSLIDQNFEKSQKSLKSLRTGKNRRKSPSVRKFAVENQSADIDYQESLSKFSSCGLKEDQTTEVVMWLKKYQTTEIVVRFAYKSSRPFFEIKRD